MMRWITCLVLSLTFGLTSIGLAAARTQSGLSQQITICQGLDTAVITLDAQGNEIAPHHCPDCLMGAVPALLPVAVTAPQGPAPARAQAPGCAAPVTDAAQPEPCAQGPPFPV